MYNGIYLENLCLSISGHRLKSRDLFFSGVATHFVDTREVYGVGNN